jgi:uncharacterized protein (DUF1697 family)
MAELVKLFTAAGCTDVQTYIQSGNVVFTARGDAVQLAAELQARIEARFGFAVPLVTRSAAEWKSALEHNPFLARGLAPETLHVAFLAARPSARAAASLDPERSRGDEFLLRGRELYLHLPNGVARTKLTNAYLDATLGTTSTLRNWRTVEKLQELSSALE